LEEEFVQADVSDEAIESEDNVDTNKNFDVTVAQGVNQA
jgi:hypothetical protein